MKGCNVEKNIIGVKLQPIVSLKENITYGCEVLSVLNPAIDAEEWFAVQQKEQILSLYQWQKKLVENVLSLPGMHFINLSISVLLSTELVEKVIADTETRQTAIELQDPESLPAMNQHQLTSLYTSLTKLRSAGFQLWLDDYKPVYFTTLKQLNWHFDGVKIDRFELINHRDMPIHLHEVVHKARALGNKILVEGIETEEDLSLAKQSQADLGQGYFWPEKRYDYVYPYFPLSQKRNT